VRFYIAPWLTKFWIAGDIEGLLWRIPEKQDGWDERERILLSRNERRKLRRVSSSVGVYLGVPPNEIDGSM
jgi:hypothetical protein